MIHLSAGRIGDNVHAEGMVSAPTGGKELSGEEASKRMAAYAAVDQHIKSNHTIIGIGYGHVMNNAGRNDQTTQLT